MSHMHSVQKRKCVRISGRASCSDSGASLRLTHFYFCTLCLRELEYVHIQTHPGKMFTFCVENRVLLDWILAGSLWRKIIIPKIVLIWSMAPWTDKGKVVEQRWFYWWSLGSSLFAHSDAHGGGRVECEKKRCTTVVLSYVPTRASWNPAGVEPVHWKLADIDTGSLIAVQIKSVPY